VLIRVARGFLGPYRAQLVVVVVLQLIATIAALVLPTMNADIIDNGVVTGDTDYILRVGALMLVVSLGQVLCQVGAVRAGAQAAMGLGRDVRAAVFHHVLRFSARELGMFGTPSLITRTTNDVQQVQMLVLMTFTMMVVAPIMGIGGIVMAVRLDAPLSLLLVVVVPVLGLVVALLVWRMRPLFRSMQVRIDAINLVLREQITGVRVIRAFVRDEHERRRFDAVNQDLFVVSLGVGRLMALMFPAVMLVTNVASVAVMWFGAMRIDSGEMQIGALTAFLTYLMQILMAVMLATFMFVMLPRAEVSAERIQEVLDTSTSVLPPVQGVVPAEPVGRLELRGVSFGYPGGEEPVLCDVDLVAGPGQVTAIVGSTGSGKSTLLGLVPRLYDVTGGAVLVDGVDVRDLEPAALSRAVGLVPQRPYLFSGTVASNLRYGRPDATDDELWHALDVAQARSFVAALPDGLATPVAQGGTTFSGGQRQRLAIARALVHRPRVYLFDDSFSALDYATDAALRAALAADTADAAVVIVAQRIATIRRADRIVVLDDGRVVATGTHRELMATDPTYREIVLSQLTEQEAAA
jgi:ATP-binding cassette subfamily B protein